MNFKEFTKVDECNTLIESFDDELKLMIDHDALEPYKHGVEDVKRDIVRKFSPKLKSWAQDVLSLSTKLEPGFEKLIIKIIDNSDNIARQLLDYSADRTSGASPKYRFK